MVPCLNPMLEISRFCSGETLCRSWNNRGIHGECLDAQDNRSFFYKNIVLLSSYRVARMAVLPGRLTSTLPSWMTSLTWRAISSKIMATCCGVLVSAKTTSGKLVRKDRVWSKLAKYCNVSSGLAVDDDADDADFDAVMEWIICSASLRSMVPFLTEASISERDEFDAKCRCVWPPLPARKLKDNNRWPLEQKAVRQYEAILVVIILILDFNTNLLLSLDNLHLIKSTPVPAIPNISSLSDTLLIVPDGWPSLSVRFASDHLLTLSRIPFWCNCRHKVGLFVLFLFDENELAVALCLGRQGTSFVQKGKKSRPQTSYSRIQPL